MPAVVRSLENLDGLKDICGQTSPQIDHLMHTRSQSTQCVRICLMFLIYFLDTVDLLRFRSRTASAASTEQKNCTSKLYICETLFCKIMTP
jgi:hypothetical protein